ncbi:TPA: LysR substrate-binding domain-containing protein [Neisseria oralis]
MRFSGGVRQGRQSSEWPKFDFQTASSRTLINMAAHGLGVAFVPAMAAEKYTAAGRLKRLLPAKTKCFIEFLLGRMGRDTAKAV